MKQNSFSAKRISSRLLIGIFICTIMLIANPAGLHADRIHLLDNEVPTIGADFAVVSFTTVSDGPAGFRPLFPATTRVSYCIAGPGGKCGDRRTVVETEPAYYHLLRLPGLRSDSVYRYHIEVTGNSGGTNSTSSALNKVELPGAEFANGSFRTLKRPPGRLLFTFASIADIQLAAPDDHYFNDQVIVGKGRALPAGERSAGLSAAGPYLELTGADSVGQMFRESSDLARLAVDQINQYSGVSFSVIRGDLSQGGKLSEFAMTAEILDRLRAPYYAIPGNHDAIVNGGAEGRAGWNRYFPAKSYRAVRMPGVAIVALDTAYPKVRGGIEHEGYLGREQFYWLAETLRDNRLPVMIFTHHPPERITLWDGRPAKPVLTELFKKNGNVSAFLAGHGHRNKFKGAMWPRGTLSVEGTTLVQYPSGFHLYDIYEGGFIQTFHKVASPKGLAISEESRRIQRLGPYASQLVRAGTDRDRNFAVLFANTRGIISGSEVIGTD